MKVINRITCLAVFTTTSTLAHSFELGVNTWIGDGKTQWAHNAQFLDPALGDPTSRLIYEDATGPIFEITAEHQFTPEFDLAGSVLMGSISEGTNFDEDYLSAEYVTNQGFPTSEDFKFLETDGVIKDGDVNGFTAEAGYTFTGMRSPFRISGGYMHWGESYDAYGGNIVVCRLEGCPSPGTTIIPDSVVSLSDEVTWKMLYIGGDANFQLSANTDVNIGVNFMPWGTAKNVDTHHLRDDLAKPSLVQEADASGWEAELMLTYRFNSGLALRGGYRYRTLSVDYTKNGHTGFLADGQQFTADLRELESTRSGALLGLSYSF